MAKSVCNAKAQLAQGSVISQDYEMKLTSSLTPVIFITPHSFIRLFFPAETMNLSFICC